MKLGIWALLGAVGAALAGCGPATQAKLPIGLSPLVVAGQEIHVEIADNPTKRDTGLMYRDSLAEDRGMIHAFPRVEIQSFYMKNNRFPIDIAYIDDDGEIVTIHTMAVEETKQDVLYKRYRSDRPVPYGLQMTGGWFAKNGVKVGDKVTQLPPKPRF